MQIKGFEHTDKKCDDCGRATSTKEIRCEHQSLFLCEDCRKLLKTLLYCNLR